VREDGEVVFVLDGIGFTFIQLKRAVLASDTSPITAWSMSQSMRIDDIIETLLILEEMSENG